MASEQGTLTDRAMALNNSHLKHLEVEIISMKPKNFKSIIFISRKICKLYLTKLN